MERCKADSEVVLIEIEGGGHTWPGQKPIVSLLGESTMDISANDLMWEFFRSIRNDRPNRVSRHAIIEGHALRNWQSKNRNMIREIQMQHISPLFFTVMLLVSIASLGAADAR